MRCRRPRAAPVVWLTALVLLVVSARPVAAADQEPPDRLRPLAQLVVPGFDLSSTSPVSGTGWTTGFPAASVSAFVLAAAEDVVAGYASVHENRVGNGRVTITAVELDREVRSNELEDARKVLARLGEQTTLSTGTLSDALAARVVLSTPGRSDEPADVVLLASRHVLVRITAQGGAADGRTVVEVAERADEALRSVAGYQPVASDELFDLVGKVFLGVWLVLAFVLLGPRGVIARRRRAARAPVRDGEEPPWSDPR